jgi:hypothetical protein
MCLLVVCEPNSTPKRDDLHNGACSNPHGFGFSIDTGSEIITERSMSARKSINRFLELRAQYPNGYAMWHARYATHGVKNETNCHPFKVGSTDYDTYLAHNGVLDISIHKQDKRSDTRVFAEDTLPLLGGAPALDDDNVFTIISAWAKGSKIAIMTNDPRCKYRMYLINENLGTWDNDGIWWSNSSHKRTTYTTTYYSEPAKVTTLYPKEKPSDPMSLTYWDYDDDLDVDVEVIDNCLTCDAEVVLNENPYYCPQCMACFDCFMDINECMCYHPQKFKSSQDFADFFPEW